MLHTKILRNQFAPSLIQKLNLRAATAYNGQAGYGHLLSQSLGRITRGVQHLCGVFVTAHKVDKNWRQLTFQGKKSLQWNTMQLKAVRICPSYVSSILETTRYDINMNVLIRVLTLDAPMGIQETFSTSLLEKSLYSCKST